MKSQLDFDYSTPMGSFWTNLFGGKDYKEMTSYAVGIDYINKFHSYNKTRAQDYVDALYKNLGYNTALAQITSLGDAIKLIEYSEGDVDNVAKAMAQASLGKVPSGIGAFRFALQNDATKTPFVDSIVENKVVQSFENVGNAIINTGSAALDVTNAAVSTLSFGARMASLFPYLAVAGGLYLGYKYLSNGGYVGVTKKVVNSKLMKDLLK